AREAVQLYASFYSDPADPDDLLDRLGLAEKAGTAFKDLSGGQQQRLSIALALVGRPRIAILDELTTGLDPHARREVWDLIEQVRRSGVTIVLVTHFMDAAERLADRVLTTDSGRGVAAGAPAELTASDGHQCRMRTSLPVGMPERLRQLPPVRDVVSTGDRCTITGEPEALPAVVGLLWQEGIVPTD